jgi:YD repeat-containing protein
MLLWTAVAIGQDFAGLHTPGDGLRLAANDLLEASIKDSLKPRTGGSANDKGRMQYSIPLVVPATTLHPNVSLAYDSAVGEHTWIARGWTLQHGAMQVQRIVGQERAQAYADVDSPHRVSGPGVDGILHRVDGQWVFSTNGTKNLAVEWTPGGLTLVRDGVTTYLEPVSGVPMGPDGPGQYLPVATVDPMGNLMEFAWSGTRLDAIEYGGWCNSSGSRNCQTEPHAFAVDFWYSGREVATTDARYGYVETRAERLDRVTVTPLVSGVERLSYRLFHDDVEFGSERSKGLRRVQRHGFDGSVDVLATMTYTDWRPFSEALDVGSAPVALTRHATVPVPGALWATVSSPQLSVQDVSGDGVPEYLDHVFQQTTAVNRQADDTFQQNQVVSGAPGAGRTPESVSVLCALDKQQTYTRSMLVDVDSDGRVDFLESTADLAYYTGNMEDQVLDGQDMCLANEEVADPGSVWKVFYGKPGGGFEGVSSVYDAPLPFPEVGAITPMTAHNEAPYSVPRGQLTPNGAVSLIDMDGDGWRDVVHVRTRDLHVPVSSPVEVYLKIPGRNAGWSATPVVWHPGGEDFLGISTTVSFNEVEQENFSGHAFQSGKLIESYTMAGFRDLNGDGLPDYVVSCPDDWGVTGSGAAEDEYWWCGSREHSAQGVSAPDQWRVYLNNGHGFEDPRAWLLPVGELGLGAEVSGLTRVAEGVNASDACAIASGGQAPFIPDWTNDVLIGSELQYLDLVMSTLADLGAYWVVEDSLDWRQSLLELMASSQQVDAMVSGTYCPDFTSPWIDSFDGRFGALAGGGLPQMVQATLHDIDGDGRPDYADFEHGVWYRNLGDSFDSAMQALPAHLPHALSHTYRVQSARMFPGWHEDVGFAYPSGVTTQTMTQDLFRVMDVDGNGMLDVVYPHDVVRIATQDQFNDYPALNLQKEVLYGQRIPPGLLESIELGTGAITTVEYTPTSYTSPSGELTASGDALPVHDMRGSGSVVTSLEVEDPATGEQSARRYAYHDGKCFDGTCRGFGRIVEEVHSRSDRHDGDGWVHLSKTTTRFDVERDYTVVLDRDVWADHSHVPGFAGSLAPRYNTSNVYLTTSDVVSESRLQYRTVNEYAADGPDSRSFLTTVAYGPTGEVTSVRMEGTHQRETVQMETDFVVNPSLGLLVPSQQRGLSWSDEDNALQLIEQRFYSYDGRSEGQSPTAGLLTRERVCSGPTDRLCDESILYDVHRDRRGAVVQTEQRQSGGMPFASTYFGDYVYGSSHPGWSANELGHVTFFTYDDMGRQVETVDANGVARGTVFDGLGRPVGSSLTSADGDHFTTSSTTYHLGPPVIVESSTMEYDRHGAQLPPTRSFEVLNGFGDTLWAYEPHVDGTWRATQTVSDTFGLTIQVGDPVVTATEPWQGFPTTTATRDTWFDAFGLPKSAQASSGDAPAMSQEVAPGRVRTTDGAGFVTETQADPLGRTTAVWQGRGTLEQVARYKYDGHGRLTEFETADGDRYKYDFDGAGRLHRVQRAAGGSWQPYRRYVHDGPSLVEVRDVDDEVVVTWSYDALQRPLDQMVRRGSTWDRYQWTWDTDGRKQWFGALFQTSDPSGEVYHLFDEGSPWGRLGRETRMQRQNLDGSILTFETELDFAGRTVLKRWPTGTEVQTTYDPSGLKLRDDVYLTDGREETFHYEYTGVPTGELRSWKADQSGLWQVYDYAAPGRVYSSAMYLEGQELLNQLEFNYLDNGWPFAVQRYSAALQNGHVTIASFDDLGRVAQTSDGSRVLEQFAYSTGGTMLTHGHLFERRSGGGGFVEWSYDSPGPFGQVGDRVADREGVELVDHHVWDQESRLRSWVRLEDGRSVWNSDYSYDGLGRLSRIESLSGATQLFYDAEHELVYEERNGQTYARSGGYHRGPEGETEAVLAHLRVRTTDRGAVELRYLLLDADGSAATVYDEHADVVSEEVRGTYGVPIEDSALSFNKDPWLLDGMHGSEPDRDNRVVHHRRRHTLFRDGMWMQPEPLLARGGPPKLDRPLDVGRYYGAGNPWLLADRTGENPQWAWNASVSINTGAGEGLLGVMGIPGGKPINPLDLAAGLYQAITDPVGTVETVAAQTFDEVRANPIRALSKTLTETLLGGGLAKVGAATRAANTTRTLNRAIGSPCNCFAEGTEVDTICGPLPIEEITTGDRVVSVDLETALPAPTFLDRPARRCSLAKHAAMAIVPAMMAACVPDVGPLPHPMAVVEVYNPRTGSWLPGTGGQLAVGDEVLHEGHLLHITASGAEDRGPAERRDLVLADGTWMGGDSALVPGAGDWVRVLGDGPTSGHWLLEDLQAGMSFAYAGRVFEADIVEGALLATPTERVLSRVVFPFERVAEGLIEAEVAYDDGTVEVVEATPDHPFRSGEQWLPLGELEIGASLHVDRGSAVLVSKTWRQGEVEVFNFGVKGTHNYVVASRSVLVHNACVWTSGDPHVASIANAIEARFPGHVADVNVDVVGSSGRVREVDILLQDGTILQVKEGKARGLNKQLTETQNDFPNDVVIGVHPDNRGRSFQHSIDAAGNTSSSDVSDVIDVVAP